MTKKLLRQSLQNGFALFCLTPGLFAFFSPLIYLFIYFYPDSAVSLCWSPKQQQNMHFNCAAKQINTANLLWAAKFRYYTSQVKIRCEINKSLSYQMGLGNTIEIASQYQGNTLFHIF